MEQNQKLIARVIDTLRDRHIVLHCLQIMPKNKFTFSKVYQDAQGQNARRRYVTAKLEVRTTVVLKKLESAMEQAMNAQRGSIGLALLFQ
jgi:hypothetical protein